MEGGTHEHGCTAKDKVPNHVPLVGHAVVEPCILDTRQAERNQREPGKATCRAILEQEVRLNVEDRKGDHEDGRVGECVGLYGVDVDGDRHGGSEEPRSGEG